MVEGTARYLSMAALVAIHLGLAMVLGSVASQLWVRAAAASPWKARTLTQAHVLRLVGFGIGSVGLLAAAWLEAASMADEGQAVSIAQLKALVLDTHYGHAWLVGLAGWAVAGGLLLSASQATRLTAGLISLGVFVLARSVVSHAGAQGDYTLDVAVDWLHLMVVCLWVGIVVVGSVQRLPESLASLSDREGAVRWVALMSDTATLVLVGVGATGLYKVWQGLAGGGSLEVYVRSDYGKTLLVKLGLVGAAAVLGGLNKFVVLPKLLQSLSTGESHEKPWRRSLVAALRVELLVLGLVLVAAAVLSSSELPGTS